MEFAELLSWLWRSSLQASVLVLLVLLIQRVSRSRVGSRWHYALWFLVLGRLVIPVMPESSFSIFNFARMDHGVLSSWSTTGGERAVAASTPDAAVAQPAGSGISSVLIAPEVSDGERFLEVWGLKTVGFLWLVVALVVASRLSLRSRRFSRRLAQTVPISDPKVIQLLEDCSETMGVRRRLKLVETDEVESPALFGFLRPRLLLPLGMLENSSREDLRYVFLHELAHIRRGDGWVHWLLAFLQALHWFNPVLWIAFRRMRADRELACDELVLSRTGGEENIRYGEAILRLLEGQAGVGRLPGLIGIVDSREQVKRRIRSIAEFRNGRSNWSVWPVMLVALLGFGTLTDGLSPNVAEGEIERAMNANLTLLDLSMDYDLLEDEKSQFGTWEVVPKGLQVLGGVPFDVGGMVRLFGTIPPPHGTTYRDEVTGIPVGRAVAPPSWNWLDRGRGIVDREPRAALQRWGRGGFADHLREACARLVEAG